MTFQHSLLIAAIVVLWFALRTVRHPFFNRLSLLCPPVASFLLGYFLTHRTLVGSLLAGSWLFLPWLELLTRVRSIRLPLDKQLKSCAPPDREEFPSIAELTRQFEDEGFERLDDLGWDWEQQHQFYRVFSHTNEPIQGAICLTEQEGMAFYYLSLSSREHEGNHWVTWNYPFAYTLQIPPHLKINLQRGDMQLAQMMQSHRHFLQQNKAQNLEIEPLKEVENFVFGIRRDMSLQIAHNVEKGVLLHDSEGHVRYSWRGLFYLWLQFLRELVRFS